MPAFWHSASAASPTLADALHYCTHRQHTAKYAEMGNTRVHPELLQEPRSPRSERSIEDLKLQIQALEQQLYEAKEAQKADEVEKLIDEAEQSMFRHNEEMSPVAKKQINAQPVPPPRPPVEPHPSRPSGAAGKSVEIDS